METIHNTEKRNGILYPMMLIAAIAVIIFSVLGIATMTGVIPSARSGSYPAQDGESAADSRQSSATAKSARPRLVSSSANCADCDVAESIRQ